MRFMSPNHLQGKLNLASRCLCRVDQSRARDGIARLIEDGEVIRRRSKICPVKEIEKLGPELNIRVLRKQSRVIVLENRCVKLRYAGTDECIPPEVASEIRRIRKRQTLSFDVMVGIPGIRQRLTARPDHTIRRLVGFIQLHAQWVAAQQRRKRLAGRSSVNSSQLPASKCPLREPRAHFRSGQFPGKVGSKNLAYVEVRQPASCTLVEEERIEQPVGKGVVRHRRRERRGQ